MNDDSVMADGRVPALGTGGRRRLVIAEVDAASACCFVTAFDANKREGDRVEQCMSEKETYRERSVRIIGTTNASRLTPLMISFDGRSPFSRFSQKSSCSETKKDDIDSHEESKPASLREDEDDVC